MMQIRKADPNDILRFQNGEWILRGDLKNPDDIEHDYEVIPVESPEWDLIARSA